MIGQSFPDYFYRLRTSSDGYKLLLTDLIRLFEEQLQEEEILKRCQHLNPGNEYYVEIAVDNKDLKCYDNFLPITLILKKYEENGLVQQVHSYDID